MRLRLAILTSAVIFTSTTLASAQDECPPGSWFCEEEPAEDPQEPIDVEEEEPAGAPAPPTAVAVPKKTSITCNERLACRLPEIVFQHCLSRKDHEC